MATAEGFNFDNYLRTLESKDVEKMLAFFAEDVEIYSEDLEQPIRGKGTLRQFSELAFPVVSKLQIKPLMVLQKGDHLSALVQSTVSYSGDLDLPGGVHLPLKGKSAKLNGAFFATLNEEGKFVWIHRVRDTWSAMKQLGIRPEEIDRLQQQFQQMQAQASAPA